MKIGTRDVYFWGCLYSLDTGGNGRASGNGTAGTAMAVPVFEGENGVAWILT